MALIVVVVNGWEGYAGVRRAIAAECRGFMPGGQRGGIEGHGWVAEREHGMALVMNGWEGYAGVRGPITAEWRGFMAGGHCWGIEGHDGGRGKKGVGSPCPIYSPNLAFNRVLIEKWRQRLVVQSLAQFTLGERPIYVPRCQQSLQILKRSDLRRNPSCQGSTTESWDSILATVRSPG